MKKMMALLLALVMVLGLTATAYADETQASTEAETTAAEVTYDHPLTVTGLKKGDTAKFYQVIEWVGDADGNVAGWKAVSTYADILTEAKLKEVLVGTKADPDAEPPVEAKDPTGITSELAGQLAAKATGGVDGTVEDGTATLDNAEAGLWMAIVTPADSSNVYNPVFVAADYNKQAGGTVALSDEYNGDAVAKSSTVTLEKKGEDKESVDTDKEHTVAVGDVLDFTVKTQIPGYGDVYENPKFDVTDTLSGLEMVGGSIEVKSGETTLKLGDDYTVEPEDYDKVTTYTISFTNDYLTSLKAATPITITYDATVTVDAEDAINQTDNEVSIKYSHNPNDQDDYDVKKDTTQHYTFTLDASGLGAGASETQHGKKTSELVKIGVDAAGNPVVEKTESSEVFDKEIETWEGPLEGAVFGLFTDAAGTTPLKDKDGNDVKATTGADGRMTFTGLDAGTYYLKEISAPTGYVTSTEVHTVVIAATTKTVKVTEYYKDGAWSAEASEGAKKVEYETEVLDTYTVTVDGKTAAEYKFKNQETATSNDIVWEEAECIEHPFELENTQGTELPSTGGIGTTIFYIVGAILVLGAGIALITKKRMSAM